MAPLVVGLLTRLFEVERSLIQERTRESVEHCRKMGGKLGGRLKTNAKNESLVLRLRKEGEFFQVDEGTDGSRSGDDHPNRQRKVGDIVLKIHVGVGLGFFLFTNSEARQITPDLMRLTANAIAPEQDGNTFRDRVKDALVEKVMEGD